MIENFERYQPIIGDWEAFVAAVQRPLPTTIWANSLKTTAVSLEKRLRESGVALAPLDWYAGGYRLLSNVQPGLRWEYLAGLYHVQEEVSMIPVTLLAPQPTDRILDMCAAPGNKTAQMGVMMGNRGTIVANDRSGGRMRAARQVLNRIGLVNVTTLTYDAASLPGDVGLFDKVLADVPCTCEGTCRKVPQVMQRASAYNSRRMAKIQRAIMRKAVQLCRPGGRIVYSTCTFAPEENELVLDSMLHEFEGQIRLLPVVIPGFETAPGLTQWEERPLHSDIRHAHRIWPHQNDTGGFFIAVLEKLAPETSSPRSHSLYSHSVVADVYPDRLENDQWGEQLTIRFGIPASLLADYDIVRWGRRANWIVNRDHQPPQRPEPDAIGMIFMRTDGKYPKLTTAAALLLGSQATRNVVDVTAEQAQAYLTRQDTAVTPEQAAACTGTGYVILRYDGMVLGIGVYREHLASIESAFPKGWAREKILI